MEELFFCVHTISESSVEDLQLTLDTREYEILSYAAKIVGPTYAEAQEILHENQLHFLTKYRYRIPGLNLSPFAEKVEIEGRTEYYTSTHEVYTDHAMYELWSRVAVSDALTSFDEWLASSDADLEKPTNRACAMLRRCVNQAKNFFPEANKTTSKTTDTTSKTTDTTSETSERIVSPFHSKIINEKTYQNKAGRELTFAKIATMIVEKTLNGEIIPPNIAELSKTVKEMGLFPQTVKTIENMLGDSPIKGLLERAHKRPSDVDSKEYQEWRENFTKGVRLFEAPLIARNDAGLTDEERKREIDQPSKKPIPATNKKKEAQNERK